MNSVFIGVKSNEEKMFMIYEGTEEAKKHFKEGKKFTGEQLIQKTKEVLHSSRTALYGKPYFF